MKNIVVSNRNWKDLRKIRDELGEKHYSKVIDVIVDTYRIHTSSKDMTIHENITEIKPKVNEKIDLGKIEVKNHVSSKDMKTHEKRKKTNDDKMWDI